LFIATGSFSMDNTARAIRHAAHALRVTCIHSAVLVAVQLDRLDGLVATEGPFRLMLIAGSLVYGFGAGLTIAVDVKMYLGRWGLASARGRLALGAGLRDSQRRRHPTLAWKVWRQEVPWMTVYFSIGVWTSLAMVLVERAVSHP
jgi:hypothetical protein